MKKSQLELAFYRYPLHRAHVYRTRQLFANDAKLSLPIDLIDGGRQLQLEINYASNYFKSNRLTPNAQKTKSITFKRRHQSIPFIHYIVNTAIQQVNGITGLGVILDEKLSIKNQIDHIVSREKTILAWIKQYLSFSSSNHIKSRGFETGRVLSHSGHRQCTDSTEKGRNIRDKSCIQLVASA